MRMVKYKTFWAYAGKGIQQEEPLVEFVLDIFYLIQDYGVIPPLHVLNEVLKKGGDSGGMGPGTKWRSFTIKPDEYQELVEALLKLDVESARTKHPYIRFDKIVTDDVLDNAENDWEWFSRKVDKYKREENGS